jgi:hypothetical protein
MERERVETAIREAFAGVRLGNGVSLRQAQVIDEWGSAAEVDAVPRPKIADDWTALAASELENAAIAHLDGDGLRYYLPALMLWLLDHHDEDPSSMTSIGTISALAFSRERDAPYLETYAGFSAEQRSAIARYLDALPRLIALDPEDLKRVQRSLDRYWSQFLT